MAQWLEREVEAMTARLTGRRRRRPGLGGAGAALLWYLAIGLGILWYAGGDRMVAEVQARLEVPAAETPQ